MSARLCITSAAGVLLALFLAVFRNLPRAWRFTVELCNGIVELNRIIPVLRQIGNDFSENGGASVKDKIVQTHAMAVTHDRTLAEHTAAIDRLAAKLELR